jgi:hypothetical protein
VAQAPAAFKKGYGLFRNPIDVADAQSIFARAVVVIPVITFLRIHLNFISGLLEMRCECIENEVIRKFRKFIAGVRR